MDADPRRSSVRGVRPPVLFAPGAGALGLIWAIASYSIVFGILFIALALRRRKYGHPFNYMGMTDCNTRIHPLCWSGWDAPTGRRTVNIEPLLGSLATVMSPPIISDCSRAQGWCRRIALSGIRNE